MLGWPQDPGDEPPVTTNRGAARPPRPSSSSSSSAAAAAAAASTCGTAAAAALAGVDALVERWFSEGLSSDMKQLVATLEVLSGLGGGSMPSPGSGHGGRAGGGKQQQQQQSAARGAEADGGGLIDYGDTFQVGVHGGASAAVSD